MTTMYRLRATLCAAVLLMTASSAGAQSRITGFSDADVSAQRAREQTAISRIKPAQLDTMSQVMSREPHVAGSEAQARTRDYALARTRAAGLRSESKTYSVFLPWPTVFELELLAPERKTFRLTEPPVPGDAASALPQYPWVNGYSGQGEGQAEVVYVNYGLHEDYAALDSAGVSVLGRIAIARYGNSFRGIKARLAEQNGAIALLIYSDPEDDGFVRGDVYPEGPYRPSTSVQRGSVMNGAGDPSTPGWPSVAGARRVEPGSQGGNEISKIPVLPVSYEIAETILRNVKGKDIPNQSWQGGLAFRYHLGPGPARVRVKVEDDRATRGYKDIWNTIAWLPGTDRADEWVVVGGHRDAWNAGAGDNVSGTATVLAAAEALAQLAKSGQRPRRTIVFATWDAEEWGLIGSSEWVEELRDDLNAKAVAYLNFDGGASGPNFGGSGSPSLKQFIRDVARGVNDPDGGTVYERWRKRVITNPADTSDVTLGNLGGGSDFAGFYNHLGIPSGGFGFGGGGGSYHSGYDTYTYVSKFSDPGFVRHAANAQLISVALLRLANADVLPYDYVEFARELRGVIGRLRMEASGKSLGEVSLDRLDAAFERLGNGARDFAVARDAALAHASGTQRTDRTNVANRHLMLVERTLARPEGLANRPWYRNLIFASDYRNGYATLAFPGIADAIREGDAARARTESDDLAARVDAARGHLEAATAALR